jgi:hypothetical protein
MRRLRMVAARLRNAAQRFTGPGWLAIRCEIAERDYANQPPVAADHRQSPQFEIAHVLKDIVDFLVVKAASYLGAHDVPDLGVGAFALRDPADGNVAVRDHPDQPVILTDGQNTGVKIGHGSCGILQGLVRTGDLNILCHALADSHDFLLEVQRPADPAIKV